MLRIIGIVVVVTMLALAPARGEIAARLGSDDGFCADYPQHSCTCAHRTLPRDTLIRIRRIGRIIVCRVAAAELPAGVDFGVNASAADRLGLVAPAHVRIERLGRLE